MNTVKSKEDQIFFKLPYSMKSDWKVHLIFGIILLPFVFFFLYAYNRDQDIDTFSIFIFFLISWIAVTLFLLRPRYKIFQDRLVFNPFGSQPMNIFYRDIKKIEHYLGCSLNFYFFSTDEPFALGFKNENKQSLRILLKVIQQYSAEIEIDKTLFKILYVEKREKNLKHIKKKQKITSYPFIIVGVTTLFVFIINLSIIFSSGKSDYQEDIAEWAMMFIVILSVPLLCSLLLIIMERYDGKVSKGRTKTNILFVITIASLLAFGYFQSQAYLDYYDTPSQTSGILLKIEAFGGEYADAGLAFTLDPSINTWKTGNDYSWKKVDFYLSYFTQYIGKEITITYTPRFNSLASLQDEQGNYIYRASDPCLKFISEDNYCK